MSPDIGVYSLDVGQGDATIIVLPEGAGAVVFDCHDERVVSQVLRTWGIATIQAFIISHLDIDHIRGALSFLRSHPERNGRVGEFQVRQMWL